MPSTSSNIYTIGFHGEIILVVPSFSSYSNFFFFLVEAMPGISSVKFKNEAKPLSPEAAQHLELMK